MSTSIVNVSRIEKLIGIQEAVEIGKRTKGSRVRRRLKK